ncbi:hypothetical protein SAMN05518871_10433 [Psychrobacillus sp. OK028]|uniref:hypothetical protein n=1 Tax=Psychrobacillus sp. OK028 TaxID=1884359 RepID=UPI000881B2DD|nr:hypothetical protein [Psychrobacillus sp. OK028]SDN23002.1 hypothetical protein SAMN05518871_10433 [Psychrobacillus sp. OK028]
MYNELSSGIKSSITRSITKAFEIYMTNISWDEELFNIEDFVKSWQLYIVESATWFEKVPKEIKESPEFHEEIALKINASIEKILSEPVNEDLIASIEIMQDKLGTQYKYGCKAEALYVESLLKEMQKQA